MPCQISSAKTRHLKRFTIIMFYYHLRPEYNKYNYFSRVHVYVYKWLCLNKPELFFNNE